MDKKATLRKICAVSLAAVMLCAGGIAAQTGAVSGSGFSALTVRAVGEETPASSFVYEENADGEIVITKFIGNETEVVVPAEINGKKVATLTMDVFNHNESIVKVTLSEGIEKIEDGFIAGEGTGCFFGCIALEEVILPNSLTYLGQGTFSNCTSLKSITLSDQLDKIQASTFYFCKALTSVTIPGNVKTIESGAFGFCDSLKSVEIPASVESIKGNPFNNCGELESIDIDAEKRLREISLLEYEINEIDSARLKLGEDEKLEEEYKLMSNANNIASALSDARNELESGCADSVSRAARTLIRVSDFSEELRSISDAVADIESMIGECIRDMDGYMSENDFSQEDFEQVEKRLDMINGFKAKYGNSIEKILEYRDNNSTRLESLINSDERVNQLKDKLSELETQINLVCDSLTRIRKEGSVSLCEGITKALNELNFNDASFKVEFEQKDRFTLCGRDNAIFVIRSNVGEGFKPLSKIASGGELSRVMLAIKTVIADTQNMESFIFDEIDAGISGRTAQQVAFALDRLSKNRQIICITHLSQLAAMADVNYIIEKKVEGERTFTGIRQLDEEEVTDELARIIGGTKITDSVIESAREMRQLARKCKKDNT